MGEAFRDGNPMGDTTIRIRISVGELSEEYAVRNREGYFWTTGFVIGYLAAQGYDPDEIEVEVL